MQKNMVNEATLTSIRGLTEIAESRGQTLAQLAIAWTLRSKNVTSALVGASSVAQLEANLAAVGTLQFTADELTAIDEFAVDMDINLWAESSDVV